MHKRFYLMCFLWCLPFHKWHNRSLIALFHYCIFGDLQCKKTFYYVSQAYCFPQVSLLWFCTCPANAVSGKMTSWAPERSCLFISGAHKQWGSLRMHRGTGLGLVQAAIDVVQPPHSLGNSLKLKSEAVCFISLSAVPSSSWLLQDAFPSMTPR